MKKKVLGWYRTFRHNIEYSDDYFKKVMIILLILLLIDLIVLYFIWGGK